VLFLVFFSSTQPFVSIKETSMSFENGLIDMRSDTVTHPTPAMRVAMANAEVGDDVYGEDPTINRLQELAAEKTGLEAGLFVSSGTMANLVALLTHCQRGSEAIVGKCSHIFEDEAGGMAAVGGIMAAVVPNQADGTLRLEDISAAIRQDDIHYPRTRLVCLENTQNICGGVPLSRVYMRQVADLAHSRGLKLHLDGARLFNSAVAQNISAGDLIAGVDSVMFCLSKGLCAPVGSVLCGSKDFIAEALRQRKMVGGGMRQAGVLAAAGLLALETMVDRLEEDHRNARRLADGLRELPGILLETETPQTNMVYFHLSSSVKKTFPEVRAQMQQRGILVDPRLVTHYWIDSKDIEKVIHAFRDVLHA
jgi:threonine aldolase